jgi:hypothetical protein
MILDKFNDLRDREVTHWKKVEAAYKSLFARWLADDDISFFFDYIYPTPKWDIRRTFWEKYAKKQLISESWPILGIKAIENLTAEQKRTAKYGKLKKHGKIQSAILFRIESLVVAEFSILGSCFIYPDNHPNCPLFGERKNPYGSDKLRNFMDVKSYKAGIPIHEMVDCLNKGEVIRIKHAGPWQYVIDLIFSKKLKIPMYMLKL